MFLPTSIVQQARDAGFTNAKGLEPWQEAKAGEGDGLKIMAAPGKHGVPEITFVLQAYGFTVYFGGDTLLIPELGKVAERFPKIDLALVPINGLKAMDEQVVMNAEEAGVLVGWLKPRVAVPIHYRFHGSWITDKFVLKYSGTPEQFQAAAQRAAPKTIVRVLEPGQLLSIVRVPPEEKEVEEGAEPAAETAEQPTAEGTPPPPAASATP
jgi:L-ascorbate metabolism protein UlaG (beta-lactamase superfamily)